MAGLILLWAVALSVTAFFVGRASSRRTSDELTVTAALDALVDEGLITLEDRETIWRTYATKVRAA